ncbi:MAG: DUF29 domain-containing protein [Burkholderiaceae bacterium]
MSGAVLPKPEQSQLYGADTFAWASEQAALLRAGRLDTADLEHIAEKIEDMGKERLNALASAVRNTLVHLTLLKFSPAMSRRAAWKEEIRDFRLTIGELLRDSPSLKPHLNAEMLSKQWAKAVCLASPKLGTELHLVGKLPPLCPFTLAHVLEDDFVSASDF